MDLLQVCPELRSELTALTILQVANIDLGETNSDIQSFNELSELDPEQATLFELVQLAEFAIDQPFKYAETMIETYHRVFKHAVLRDEESAEDEMIEHVREIMSHFDNVSSSSDDETEVHIQQHPPLRTKRKQNPVRASRKAFRSDAPKWRRTTPIASEPAASASSSFLPSTSTPIAVSTLFDQTISCSISDPVANTPPILSSL